MCFPYVFLIAAVVALLAPAVRAEEEKSQTVEQCKQGWKAFMPEISDAQAQSVCRCIEDEKAKHPLAAEKGATLAGPGGLDNAGPWPNILHNCLYPEEPPLPEREKK